VAGLIHGSSDEPRFLTERAADAGIQAIAEYLAHADAKIERLLIVLDVDKTPGDEPDSVTAGSGIEDPRDLIAHLVSHAAAAGRQIGLRIDILPVERPKQG